MGGAEAAMGERRNDVGDGNLTDICCVDAFRTASPANRASDSTIQVGEIKCDEKFEGKAVGQRHADDCPV